MLYFIFAKFFKKNPSKTKFFFKKYTLQKNVQMPFLCPSQAQYQIVFLGKEDNALLCMQHPDVFAKHRDFLEEN